MNGRNGDHENPAKSKRKNDKSDDKEPTKQTSQKQRDPVIDLSKSPAVEKKGKESANPSTDKQKHACAKRPLKKKHKKNEEIKKGKNGNGSQSCKVCQPYVMLCA